ncbi:cyclin-L1 [Thraustotheca clavata]|uniref:Cyclin-L1 n=1 Tax=Thraustotheca clavata TaxID=74557 RepID=A0A1V9ZCB3_9STRA|nr:cyclin-L1 [Thraustotheca clavata]
MDTPSRADGISAMDERIHRFFACELVQEAGVLLSLPPVVLATAQSLLHRFYNAQSLRDFDAFRVAMGSIFVAAKAEEQPRRLRDVVQVFFRMRNRRMGLEMSLLMPNDERFTQWSDWIVMVERQVLIEVGFSIDAMTEHPHKFLLYYVKILDGSKELAQKAWSYVNDSFRIDLCLRFDAHVIACAAVDLAARILKIPLPFKWQKLLEVDEKEMEIVESEMMSIYDIDKVQWIQPLTCVNPYVMIKGEYVGASEDDIPDSIKQENVLEEPTKKISDKNEKFIAENGSESPTLSVDKDDDDKATTLPQKTPSPQRTPSPRRSRSPRREPSPKRSPSPKRESRRRYSSQSRSRETKRRRSPRRRRSSSRSNDRSSRRSKDHSSRYRRSRSRSNDRSSRNRHKSRSRSRIRRHR